MMRPVMITEMVHREGKWVKQERGEAQFIQFAQDHTEYESGPGPIPTGIVQWVDGQLESVHVNMIRFLD